MKCWVVGRKEMQGSTTSDNILRSAGRRKRYWLGKYLEFLKRATGKAVWYTLSTTGCDGPQPQKVGEADGQPAGNSMS